MHVISMKVIGMYFNVFHVVLEIVLYGEGQSYTYSSRVEVVLVASYIRLPDSIKCCHRHTHHCMMG